MKSIFDNSPVFKNVFVKGEVSGVFTSGSGHFYFKLKDKHSVINCIIYKWFRKNIEFEIENGMKLLVTANVSIYPPHGKYQLDVRSAVEDGLGKLFIKYQQLKKKLEAEGLFDEEHKKELPRFAQKIAVVTSEGGSVIHDIIKTVNQKWPYCEILLFPAAVQGANSKKELITQIRRADNFGCDVIIVGRGGGSIEELWSFNEEEVVRCIFSCNTPVISAIGHESNVTLADLVSDVRASTPTMAATFAVEDRQKIAIDINHFKKRLTKVISSKMESNKKQLDYILSKQVFKDSSYVYGFKKSGFEELKFRFSSVSREIVNSSRFRLDNLTSEYVIRHPCKMQLDQSKSDLDEVQSHLIDSMQSMVNAQWVNLDKTADNFNFLSDKLVTSKRHELENHIKSIFSNPYQNHIDMTKNELKLAENKLTATIRTKMYSNKKQLDFILSKQIFKDSSYVYGFKKSGFEELKFRFSSVSREIVNSSRFRLDNLTSEYVIRHPCKMQLDQSKSDLDEVQSHLIDSMQLTVNAQRVNLDKAADNFSFLSDKLVTSKRHELESHIKSIFSNPYQNHIDMTKNELKLAENKLINSFKNEIEGNKKDLELMTNNFTNSSNEIILKNAHKLDSIKQKSAIKNPKALYEPKVQNLENIKNKKIIQNPDLILNHYKNQLKNHEEKLDKINQVLILKKQQKEQQARYTKIIVAIVVIMIIILIIIFGGIL